MKIILTDKYYVYNVHIDVTIVNIGATTMQKILIINGHPGTNRLSSSMAEAYREAAQKSGHEVRVLNLRELNFDPILHEGYKIIQDLEPDLIRAQEMIKLSTHLVLITPVWWGSVPALLKGFFDRVFLPGFAFKYKKDSPFWDRLLKGRTARIIITSDGPTWWNRLIFGDPTVHMLKSSVLEFCGFRTKVTKLGNVKNYKEKDISKSLKKAAALGSRGI